MTELNATLARKASAEVLRIYGGRIAFGDAAEVFRLLLGAELALVSTLHNDRPGVTVAADDALFNRVCLHNAIDRTIDTAIGLSNKLSKGAPCPSPRCVLLLKTGPKTRTV